MSNQPTIAIHWDRAIAQGVAIDRWFASVVEPVKTFAFAQIERAPDGGWLLIVFPPWTLRDHPEAKTRTARYQFGRTAKKHLETWARVNWPQLSKGWRMRTDHW